MKPADLERVRAYVDGELEAAAAAALVRDAQADPGLQRELDSQQALHSLLRSLPPIVAPPARQPRSRWAAWLGWSTRITLRPAIAAFAAVALFGLGIVADRSLGSAGRAGASPVVASAAEQVPVRFVFVGQAQKVAVAGSFNQWSESANPMVNAGEGVWETTVLMPKGEHRYQFRVDGQWMPDPLAERQAPDGMGHVDSVFRL